MSSSKNTGWYKCLFCEVYVLKTLFTHNYYTKIIIFREKSSRIFWKKCLKSLKEPKERQLAFYPLTYIPIRNFLFCCSGKIVKPYIKDYYICVAIDYDKKFQKNMC